MRTFECRPACPQPFTDAFLPWQVRDKALYTVTCFFSLTTTTSPSHLMLVFIGLIPFHVTYDDLFIADDLSAATSSVPEVILRPS